MDIQGTLNSIKQWWAGLDFETWLGTSSSDAIQVAIYFVSFFAVGFLFKKYLKFVLLCLIMSFLIIKGLEYYKVLDVDWGALNTLLGFDPAANFGTIANTAVEWVKAHVVITVASTLGFLIGYKLG